jgi:hypothetical protein
MHWVSRCLVFCGKGAQGEQASPRARGFLKTAKLCKAGTDTVQRIKREMTRAS